MAKGKYIITTEFAIDLLSIISVGVVARDNPLIEILLANIAVIGAMLFERF